MAVSIKEKEAEFARLAKTTLLHEATAFDYAAPDELYDAVAEREKGHTVICTAPLLPPYFLALPKTEQSIRFLKRGPEFATPVARTLTDAMTDKRGPLRRRQKALDDLVSGGKITPQSTLSSMSWVSRRGKKRKIHLIDVLKGAHAYAWSSQQPDPDDKTQLLGTGVFGIETITTQQGALCVVHVPSLSRHGGYTVIFNNVPYTKGDEQYALWSEMFSTISIRDSPKTRETGIDERQTFQQLTKRHFGGVDVFNFHHVMAYYAISAHYRHHIQDRLLLQPFGVPTKPLVVFDGHLQHVLLQEDTLDDRGLRKRIHRTLSEAEREIMLWRHVIRHGYSASLKAVRPLIEYNWKTKQ